MYSSTKVINQPTRICFHREKDQNQVRPTSLYPFSWVLLRQLGWFVFKEAAPENHLRLWPRWHSLVQTREKNAVEGRGESFLVQTTPFWVEFFFGGKWLTFAF